MFGLLTWRTEDDDLLDRVLDSGVPVLFGLDQAPAQGTRQYPRWERRVFIKLYDVVGHPVIQENLEPLEADTCQCACTT
jgi:chemosensory pili system protein ChpB (putative protein-glutamate methylesterase)